jgi:CheY-like chemotaxis protein
MKTLLLVEDGEVDIFLMKRALERVGSPCALQAVRNGEEAIEYLSGTGRFADPKTFPKPDMVLMDQSMPGKSGIEVLKWIREQPGLKDLQVSMLTRSAEPANSKAAFNLGAKAYLMKPSSVSGLEEILMRVVRDLANDGSGPAPK